MLCQMSAPSLSSSFLYWECKQEVEPRVVLEASGWDRKVLIFFVPERYYFQPTTLEIEPTKQMGRNRIYESNKERKRAYRLRKKEAKKKRLQLLVSKLKNQEKEIMDLKYEKNKEENDKAAAQYEKEENPMKEGMKEGDLLKQEKFKQKRCSPRASKKALSYAEEYIWQK